MEKQTEGDITYRKIKGGLIINGTSVTEWCDDNSTTVGNLRSAIFGSWNGPKAKILVKKALQDAKEKTA